MYVLRLAQGAAKLGVMTAGLFAPLWSFFSVKIALEFLTSPRAFVYKKDRSVGCFCAVHSEPLECSKG